MPDDLPTNAEEALAEAIVSPKSATIQGQSVTLPSIDELIRADQYQAQKQAAAIPTAAHVRRQRFIRQYD